jgi:hypothetical protein
MKSTIDHKEVKKWAKKAGARPARIKSGQNLKSEGELRMDFSGGKNQELEYLSWEEFFNMFEDKNLAFEYEDGKIQPGVSCKFVPRKT